MIKHLCFDQMRKEKMENWVGEYEYCDGEGFLGWRVSGDDGGEAGLYGG